MNKPFETAISAQGASAFLAPFSIDEFRDAMTNVFLHHVRDIARMTDEETAWAITKLPPDHISQHNFLESDIKAADIGFTYEHIQDTLFAFYVERLYDYAFFGLIDTECGEPYDEGPYTWFAALVCNAHRCAVAERRDFTGTNDYALHAYRCALVAETANARVMLEGGKPFYRHFLNSERDESVDAGLLTARQLALLSNMAESSILAAAGPEHPSAIETLSTHRGLRINIAVAKAWLQTADRYVPIYEYSSAGEFDLEEYHPSDPVDLLYSIGARYRNYCQRYGREKMADRAQSAGLTKTIDVPGPYFGLKIDAVTNADLMRSFANLLDLPAELLVLRGQEAWTRRELDRIEGALQHAARGG